MKKPKIKEKYVWAVVSSAGNFLVAFRLKRDAQHEQSHYFRPEAHIQRISIKSAIRRPRP